MLDIHVLNVFVVAAHTLNFTQAARLLHLSQPSVSQHIQMLEKHFDAALFNRFGRNLELTDAGRILLPMAQKAVALSLQTDQLMDSLKGQVYGHLMVGCSTTPGKYVLPQILANFHKLYPQVTVACSVSGQMDALRSLANAESHFALFSLEYSSFPEIEAIHFMDDPIVLIVPLGHPWASAGSIRIEDLPTQDYVMREAISGTYDAVAATLAEHGLFMNDLNIFITLGNAEAVALSVAEGIGVGFVSKLVVDKLCSGRVVEVPIEGVIISRQIFIGHNVQSHKSTAQEKFWQYISDGVKTGSLLKSSNRA